MANYGLKYTKTLTHKGGQVITLRIYEKYDTTVPTQMTIGNVVVGLDYGIQGRESAVDSAIQKTSLSLSLIDAPERNTSTEKWGGWEEFYTPDATKYMIRLLVDGVLQWSGFVTPDSYEEELSYHAPVTITARDNWGRLNDFTFDAEGEDGLITVADLIAEAVTRAGVDMPVSINSNAVWPMCDGAALYDHYINVKVFEGDTWWTALEDTLTSLGMVITFEGAKFIVSPLRARMLKGKADYSSVAKTSFVFEHSGHRSLAPACREIVEKQEYEFSRDMMNVRELRTTDFVAGSSYPFTSQPYGITQATMPVYALGSSGPWKNGSGTYYSLLNQFGYPAVSGDDAVRLSDARTLFIAANPGTSSDYATAPNKMRGVYCDVPMTKMKADISFHIGEAVRLYDGKTYAGTAVYDESYTSPAIGRLVARLAYTTASGTTYYWSGSSWLQGSGSFVDLKPESDDAVFTADITIPAADVDEPGTLRIHFRCGVYIIRGEYEQAYDGDGMYMPITDLRLISSREVYARHRVTTKYVETNNVIIERSPKIGAVNFDTVSPYQVLNGLYSPSTGHPAAREWYWPDNQSTKHQLPVFIHTQILPYHARPMNVLTGSVIKDSLMTLPTFSELWEYKGRDYMLMSGRVDMLSGKLVDAELREFILYDEMWEGTFPASASSATVAKDGEDEGADTASGSATSVTLGSAGGTAGITVDNYLSATSTNPVTSRAIKAYIDDSDAILEDAIGNLAERIDSLENGTSGGAGAVIFDATTSADPWSLNVLQTQTTYEEIAEAINAGRPIYMRFMSGLVAIVNAELYDSGDISLYAHLVDPESHVLRTIHTYGNSDSWSWEAFDESYASGLSSPSNVAIDFQGLYALISLSPGVADAEMASVGLTTDVISGILEARYNKAIGAGDDREVWNYDGYDGGTAINIFFRQGDGFDVHNSYSLRRDTATGYWTIYYTEI